MFSDVIGQSEVIEKLKSIIRSGRIANAYIFSGPDEIGKEFVAVNFAKALNCLSDGEDACDKCISCRKIDDGNHADVRIIRPEGTRLKIDQMRFLQRQGSYKPVEGNYKVYIIAETEKMTAEAANSMLKTLEEPAGAMVLILLTSAYNSLLPTIRSRCQSLKFTTVSEAILQKELIKRFGFSESKAKWVAIRSQGKIGRAIKFAEKNKAEENIDDEVKAFLSHINQKNGKSLLQIFKKAEELSKSEDSLDILLSWYRDLLLVKHGCSKILLTHYDKQDELQNIARLYTDSQIERVIEIVMRTQNLIQRNVNPILAIEVMMLRSFDTLSTRL